MIKKEELTNNELRWLRDALQDWKYNLYETLDVAETDDDKERISFDIKKIPVIRKRLKNMML